eukprot:1085717-Heterocapsa_arctica.AAC.1
MAGSQAPFSSMALVDQFGNPVAAAYSHVPVPEAPQQVARNGEGYVVMITSVVASPPFKLYIDCQGTVSTIPYPILLAQEIRGHICGPDFGRLTCVTTSSRNPPIWIQLLD